ncbi:unnamed protein product [Arabis nemorensis]|uniref:Uncharacterized protein n=1 Tax=Arabis nemorensis TaxID=586526 RepID=A0A565CCC4_9BRAS|nr:unnamed protein product [Arabis nemorensis]
MAGSFPYSILVDHHNELKGTILHHVWCWKICFIIYASFHARLLGPSMLVKTQVKSKRNCVNIVTALHAVLQILSSSRMVSSEI